MKILGVFLMLAGIVCFAVAVTGLPGWMIPVPADASPASIANSIGKDDYQLFVTADPWVSHFDAIVYRHKGEFTDPWFSTLGSSRSREIGKWRYIRRFSGFYDKYYFDADGKVHSNYP